MGQFHWKPDTYLELIRSEVPRYDELQEQAIAAIPFAPERVLELGMGTGETTRRLIEAYPDSWVIGLDSSPDMVFRARENYDDVQLARIEDPLPDGPWDLVIGVLSIHHLRAELKQEPLPPGQRAGPRLRDRRRGQSRRADHPDRRRTTTSRRRPPTWPSGAGGRSPGRRTTWRSCGLSTEGRDPSRHSIGLSSVWEGPGLTRYHPATYGRPEEENFQRPPRQAPRQSQGRQAEPEQLPALPQPAAAASGLPDLRHLRRARGRRPADRRPDGASHATSSRGAGPRGDRRPRRLRG